MSATNVSFCFLFLSIVLPFQTKAQPAGIDLALQKGSAQELGTYFHTNVELAIPGIEDTFTSEQAITVMASFFTEQSVKGYKRVHLSRQQEGRAKYSIGDLMTSKGTYRMTLYFDTQDKITEIRIQK